MGEAGSQLGYSGIPSSVGVKFSLAGGTDSTTGVYTDGEPITDAPATAPGQLRLSYSMVPSRINFHANFQDRYEARLVYDGTTLTETVTDLTNLGAFTMSWNISIPQVLGSKCAFVGFTAATDTAFAQQDILKWIGPGSMPYLPPMGAGVIPADATQLAAADSPLRGDLSAPCCTDAADLVPRSRRQPVPRIR